MADVKAEIMIRECADHSWFDRCVMGEAWWWQAYIPHRGQRSGFARTKEKARVKAEAPARDLAGAERPFERYTYEVTDADA
ncbi:hypothetical protein ACFOOM_12365 [Streptomyces echinoruber]|uniref:Uncharacterized protein n=1 Tax=Streptomyces echinoruber TaxID=68898 RepID=A0A918VJL5_9ACTN|nr:hypothetical protein [Streptomyces echinoruber]GHA01160.1 hypothetical protein GCM10010389_45610 [Streptomyces echinoruber]